MEGRPPTPRASAELTIPGRAKAISRARLFVRQAAETAGIAPERIEAIVPAVASVCTAVVERAYDPDELGSITLRTEVMPSKWVLAIREQGLPLDASVESGPAQPETSSRAWREVHEVVDEVRCRSLGKDGPELVGDAASECASATARTSSRPCHRSHEQHHRSNARGVL